MYVLLTLFYFCLFKVYPKYLWRLADVQIRCKRKCNTNLEERSKQTSKKIMNVEWGKSIQNRGSQVVSNRTLPACVHFHWSERLIEAATKMQIDETNSNLWQ